MHKAEVSDAFHLVKQNALRLNAEAARVGPPARRA
jgi:hypothetical protein